MASAAASGSKHGFKHALYRLLYNTSRYNQYGLRTHDMLTEFHPDVKEAVRRLPDYIKDERAFRIHRAMHYCMLKRVLPKEEWTDADDKENWYLAPYLAEVQKEFAERKEWAEK